MKVYCFFLACIACTGITLKSPSGAIGSSAQGHFSTLTVAVEDQTTNSLIRRLPLCHLSHSVVLYTYCKAQKNKCFNQWKLLLGQHLKHLVVVSKQQPVDQFAAGSEEQAPWLYMEHGPIIPEWQVGLLLVVDVWYILSNLSNEAGENRPPTGSIYCKAIIIVGF